ncbi:DUF503 domain-containing protein [Lysinibacillus sphaericus]|uniref:Cytoplasmic protein n=3 Tax=Lysinibacillus TaxID=400634 RepID=A0A2S5D3H9_LYSSH|nr:MULTISPECIES: DUF503 domain-containing protein [Lysinibacillus]AHN20960.1 hypothetical protein T479_05275 [Lysinibacillus varians]AVK97970.1 hypothetical protein LS41612_17605 [Lysinibacillus sphaericus]MCS1380883.1 DUF503 domain-containing protein [Lysinibacillus sphaericus]MED4543470.1 DUF503 domain-containing protein [Lysinibacillus sphaericus]OEC02494.1 hypothetical protein GY31_05510 [Lysinibacillus sphaericus]
MIVYVEVEFIIQTAHSLKEKRAVLQRMITRTKQKFNVSIAEIDHQNVWQRTKLALVAVSSSKDAAEREINHALHYLQSNPSWEQLNVWRDYL